MRTSLSITEQFYHEAILTCGRDVLLDDLDASRGGGDTFQLHVQSRLLLWPGLGGGGKGAPLVTLMDLSVKVGTAA